VPNAADQGPIRAHVSFVALAPDFQVTVRPLSQTTIRGTGGGVEHDVGISLTIV
jgi:hypothetical protein